MATLTEDQARMIARGLQSGQISDPAKRQEAMTLLQEFGSQKQLREDFANRSIRQDSMAQGVDEWTANFAPKAFANDEARDEYYESTGINRNRRLAEAGIDMTSGIDPAIRAKAGLLDWSFGGAESRRASVAALEHLVKEAIPEGEVPMGIPLIANFEGVPSALTRQEDGTYRYHAINPLGGDLGDLGEIAAELPQVALETAGSIVGAVAGGTAGAVAGPAGVAGGALAGSATGSAIAGYFSIPARAALARAVGIPDEIVDGAISDNAQFYNALLAAVGDVGVAAIVGATRGLANWSTGRILEPDEVDKILPEVERSLAKTRAFTEKTGIDINMGLGQLSGDEGLMQADRIARQAAKNKTSLALHGDEHTRDQAVARALDDMVNQRTRGEALQRTPEDVAVDVVSGIRGTARAADEAAEVAQRELDEFQKVTDLGRNPDAYVGTRDELWDLAERAAAAETTAWENFRASVEWQPGQGSGVLIHSPGTGPNMSPIKKVLLDLDDEAQRALLESTRNAQAKFVKDAGLPEEGTPTGLAAEYIDPRELHFTLSDLKRRRRQMDRATDFDGLRAHSLNDMIQAIEETIAKSPMVRRNGLKPVDAQQDAVIRESWTHANATSLRLHTLYDSANMRALLSKNPRTGTLDMPPGMIHRHLFKPDDPRFLSDALEAMGENPGLRAALADELVKKHRAATRTDTTGDAHRRFLDEHGDHIHLLGIDPRALKGAHGLALEAKRLRHAADSLKRNLESAFGKRIPDDGMDVLDIHTEVMKLTPEKVRNLVKYLGDNNPRLLDEVRAHSLQTLKRELTASTENEIAFKNLWTVVDTQGARLRELHGQEFVDDLKFLKQMEVLFQRDPRLAMAPVTGQGVQSAFLDLTRSMIGPLSKKQRFLSAFQRVNRRKAAALARRVITEPEDLRRFIRHKSRSIEDVLKIQGLRDLYQAYGEISDDDDFRARVAGARAKGMLEGDNPAMPEGDAEPAAGSTLVPGRESPAEAVGGERPGQVDPRNVPNTDHPAVQQLIRHEGSHKDPRTGRHSAYRDSEGVRTIGYGRNLEANPITPTEYRLMNTTASEVARNGLSDEQALVLFKNDYIRAAEQAARNPAWPNMDEPRREALINIYFNMGPSFERKFPTANKYFKEGDFVRGGQELLRGKTQGTVSRWAQQVKGRAYELAEQIITGVRQSRAPRQR